MREPRPWTVAAAAAAGTALLHGATLWAPWQGDDRRFVETAEMLRLPWGTFLSELLSTRYFSLTGEGTYQPLVTLLHRAFGPKAAALRAIGLAFHAAAGVLVWAAARRCKAGTAAAAAAAALFLAFPTHVETLVVSSFKGHVLALVFSLASLLCWERGARTRHAGWLAAAAGCLALALLSKETGLLALALIAAHRFCFGGGPLSRPERAGALALALVGAAWLWWRFAALEAPAALPPAPAPPPTLLGWYVKMLAWPFPLCRERLLPDGPVWPALASLPLAGVWLWRRRPERLFPLLACLAALAPFLGIVPFYAESPVADRYLYGASAGFALLLAPASADRRGRLLVAGVLAAWAGLTLQRALLHADLDALYRQTTRCAPGHFKAWGVYAGWRLEKGDAAAAREAAAKAVALAPNYPGGWAVLAESCRRLGDAEGEGRARAALTELLGH